MKDQGLGGSIVFVASKNALAASPGASAYCTAKAAEVHLARCSRSKARRSASASIPSIPTRCCAARRSGRANGARSAPRPTRSTRDELEEVYRQRSLLKRSVYPEDIAEAVYFFASDLSAKSTGNILNVDAGNAVSFTR